MTSRWYSLFIQLCLFENTCISRVDSRVIGPPRFKAKIAGVFYLLNILTGASALVFVGRSLVLVVYGDATILIVAACFISVTLLFYSLFKPVHRSLSLLAPSKLPSWK